MVPRNNFCIQCILYLTFCLSACGQGYYGNHTDSIKHNIIEIKDISISGLKLNSSPDQAIDLLGKPSKIRSDVDEITGEEFTVFYFGPEKKTFLYFYQSDINRFVFSEFLLFDSLLSLSIGQNTFKVEENLEKLRKVYPESYQAYEEDSSPYKAFRLVVFEEGERKGLEVLFVIRNDKIYNISTRYDE